MSSTFGGSGYHSASLLIPSLAPHARPTSRHGSTGPNGSTCFKIFPSERDDVRILLRRQIEVRLVVSERAFPLRRDEREGQMQLRHPPERAFPVLRLLRQRT